MPSVVGGCLGFLHMERTGGGAVYLALRTMGLIPESRGPDHCRWDELIGVAEVPTIGTIRDPLSWYCSCAQRAREATERWGGVWARPDEPIEVVVDRMVMGEPLRGSRAPMLGLGLYSYLAFRTFGSAADRQLRVNVLVDVCAHGPRALQIGLKALGIEQSVPVLESRNRSRGPWSTDRISDEARRRILREPVARILGYDSGAPSVIVL